MKILSLNCQRGYQPGLEGFVRSVLQKELYDFLLLQEVDARVRGYLEHPSYKAVRIFNEEAEEESEVCIVYRHAHELRDSGLQSFSSMRNDPWRGFRHPSFGLVWGDFMIDGTPFRLGSVHLHSGVDSRARLNELDKAKICLLEGESTPVVIAGDFNAGFPGEAAKMARMLAPEFAWTSKDIGPTLDSRYSENVPHLPNRIAAFLALFNIRISLRTDHVLISSEASKRYAVQCRVLPDRVSDHSPVELSLTL